MIWICSIIILCLIPACVLLYNRFPLHRIYKSKIGLQDMFDAISDPLAVISDSYILKRANHAYISLIGKSFPETIGKKCYCLLRNRSSPCEDCAITKALAHNRLITIERSPHPSGTGMISIGFSPCHLTLDSSGVYAVEHIRDITLLEKLKLDLEDKNSSLADAMKSLKAAQQSIRDELRLARMVQRGILPKGVPEINGLKLSVTYHPITDVGGDLYDFIKFSPDKMGIFIGDASGHGLSAAFVSTISKMSLYNLSSVEMPVHELLEKMNKDLLNNIHTGHYLTCVWCVMDLARKKAIFSRAGHPHPVLIKPNGEVVKLKADGTFIGLLENATYPECSLPFEAGDRLYFFTDGIYDVLNNQENRGAETLGYDKFIDILIRYNSLQFNKIISSIERRLSEFTYDDDYTLIVIEITDD